MKRRVAENGANRITDVQECDANEDEHRNIAGFKKMYF